MTEKDLKLNQLRTAMKKLLQDPMHSCRWCSKCGRCGKRDCEPVLDEKVIAHA